MAAADPANGVHSEVHLGGRYWADLAIGGFPPGPDCDADGFAPVLPVQRPPARQYVPHGFGRLARVDEPCVETYARA